MSPKADQLASLMIDEQERTGALFHFWVAPKRLDDMLLLRFYNETVVSTLVWRVPDEPWDMIVDPTGLEALHTRLCALGMDIGRARLREAILSVFAHEESRHRKDKP